ncbi:MAG: CRISPR-associated endonuclease Cas2 [Planctomycetota bacterium]|nr:MAG: CRISPR-associated endonuclease Cas2 [Planctomycetota bacterium]
MSLRRQYLVSYDISDDKRRRKVFDFLRGQGDHAQFSVFFCQWNDRELVDARSELRSFIHQKEDQVLIVDLGRKPRALEACLEVLGKAYVASNRVFIV